jgi:hypothetical protein
VSANLRLLQTRKKTNLEERWRGKCIFALNSCEGINDETLSVDKSWLVLDGCRCIYIYLPEKRGADYRMCPTGGISSFSSNYTTSLSLFVKKVLK